LGLQQNNPPDVHVAATVHYVVYYCIAMDGEPFAIDFVPQKNVVAVLKKIYTVYLEFYTIIFIFHEIMED
jgi:hypothetical protein